MGPGVSVRKAIEFYTIQLSQLADGAIFVEMTATSVDEQEAQLLTQEIISERVVSIDATVTVIKQHLYAIMPRP